MHWKIIFALGIACAGIDTAFEIDFINRITSNIFVFSAFVGASLLVHLGAIYLSVEIAKNKLKSWSRLFLSASLLTIYSVFVTTLAQFANVENNDSQAVIASVEIADLKAERTPLLAAVKICNKYDVPSNCKEQNARIKQINNELKALRQTGSNNLQNTFDRAAELIHIPAWILLAIFMMGRALFLNILMCWFVHLAVTLKAGTTRTYAGSEGVEAERDIAGHTAGHNNITSLTDGQIKGGIIDFLSQSDSGRKLKKATRQTVIDALNWRWSRGIKAKNADKWVAFMQEKIEENKNVSWVSKLFNKKRAA